MKNPNSCRDSGTRKYRKYLQTVDKMNEREYVESEARKQDTDLYFRLRKINRTGLLAGKTIIESLLIAGWIEFGGPIEGVCRYNCYRLTEAGKAKMAELNQNSD